LRADDHDICHLRLIFRWHRGPIRRVPGGLKNRAEL
jgi:hypothetical protein